MTVYIPIKLPSLANMRLHWRAMDRLKRSQKDAVLLALNCNRETVPIPPLTVTIKRMGKRKLDSDNAIISAKYVRDSVAKWYDIDDGSDLYEWRYEQAIDTQYGVEIRIEAREA